MSSSPLRIGIVAGEISGDQLGAGLVNQLKLQYPEAEFLGIGGDLMRQAGVETFADAGELSYFGVTAVLKNLGKIRKLLKRTQEKLADVDVFIGIDNPDFNLRLAQALKDARKAQADSAAATKVAQEANATEAGSTASVEALTVKPIKCIHYVSPSVWAWRPGRMQKIKSATDLVLCLLPFEVDYYRKHDHKAVFVGHRLTSQLEYLLAQNQNQFTPENIEAYVQRYSFHKDSPIMQCQGLVDFVDSLPTTAISRRLLKRNLFGYVHVPHDHELAESQQEQAQLEAELEQAEKAIAPVQVAQADKATNAETSGATYAGAKTESKRPSFFQRAAAVIDRALNNGQNLELEQLTQLQQFYPDYSQGKTPAQANGATASNSALDAASAAVSAVGASGTNASAVEADAASTAETPATTSMRPSDWLQTTASQYRPLQVAILPGSRLSEIELILPQFLEGCAQAIELGILPRSTRFVIPVAQGKQELGEKITSLLDSFSALEVVLVHGHAHAVLKSSAFALVASGTATLDCMLCHVPMVVGYKLSPFNYWLAKRLVHTQYVSLANLVFGKMRAKELIQDQLNPLTLVRQIRNLVDVEYNLAARLEYRAKHAELITNADALAAQAVSQLLAGKALSVNLDNQHYHELDLV